MPAHSSTTRDGSSVPTTRPADVGQEVAGDPGADRADRRARRATPRGTRRTRARARGRRARDWIAPMPADSAYAAPAPNATAPNHAIQSADARLNTAITAPMYATPKRVRASRSPCREALERDETDHRADAEERDEHAELGVGRVQHVVHEHDAEREERAEPERDRERGGHDRVAPTGSGTRRGSAASAVVVALGERCDGPKLGEPGDAEERHDERERVDEEHERVRAVVDLATAARRPPRTARRRAGCSRTTCRGSGRWRAGARRRPPTRSGIDASRAGRNTMLATSTRKPHR